jgi:hypothetical protein
MVRMSASGGGGPRHSPRAALRACRCGLRQFHLDGVHALGGPAVVARRPAALEAAVEDIEKPPVAADTRDRGFDRAGAGAPVGADVEVGQHVPSNRNGICERIEWQS